MKRTILLILGLALVGTAVFGMEMTFGGGIMYNHSTTSGKVTLGYKDNYPPYDSERFEIDMSMSRNGFGGFVFFGFNQYVEMNLGFLYKNPDKIELKAEGMTFSDDASEDFESTAALQLGLYLKYPIPMSDTVVFFPTAGVDAEITLSDDEAWWNDIWIRGGLGLDIFFTDTTFFRGHFIYGVAFPTGGGYDESFTEYGTRWESKLELDFTHGLLIKVGIGFMF